MKHKNHVRLTIAERRAAKQRMEQRSIRAGAFNSAVFRSEDTGIAGVMSDNPVKDVAASKGVISRFMYMTDIDDAFLCKMA